VPFPVIIVRMDSAEELYRKLCGATADSGLVAGGSNSQIGVPSGWQTCYSTEHSCYYYVNDETGYVFLLCQHSRLYRLNVGSLRGLYPKKEIRAMMHSLVVPPLRAILQVPGYLEK
jgi:hypothetical protein